MASLVEWLYAHNLKLESKQSKLLDFWGNHTHFHFLSSCRENMYFLHRVIRVIGIHTLWVQNVNTFWPSCLHQQLGLSIKNPYKCNIILYHCNLYNVQRTIEFQKHCWCDLFDVWLPILVLSTLKTLFYHCFCLNINEQQKSKCVVPYCTQYYTRIQYKYNFILLAIHFVIIISPQPIYFGCTWYAQTICCPSAMMHVWLRVSLSMNFINFVHTQ